MLALNLYDSPVATNKGLVETRLPTVIKRCTAMGKILYAIVLGTIGALLVHILKYS